MTAVTLRQKIHSYVDLADEKKLKAFYVLMKTEIDDSYLSLTTSQKSTLESREMEIKSKKSNFISSVESKKRIKALLKNKTTK
jgi:hypothetical protein